MIRLGNGILVEVDDRRYRLDPRRTTADDTNVISHAHTDHIPRSFKTLDVICSEITRDFASERCRKNLRAIKDDQVELVDAGHIPGSMMCRISGSRRVVYTGDFCVRSKAHTDGAKPLSCEVLVMEATYGKPRYRFPDHSEVVSAMKDWVSEVLHSGSSAILLSYPLGKSQELASIFREFPIFFHPSIASYNRILRTHGFDIPSEPFEDIKGGSPIVYVSSGLGKDSSRVQTMRKHGAKTAAFSGWAVDGMFGGRSSYVDRAFPLSDHCGYDELLWFVKKCAPDVVYTVHGFAKEFAGSIRSELGIDARPLIAKQRMIDQF
ncbi:MAG: hypothetical protein IH630_00175 [Thermoplasmata archaeon]|nr:hypothetical protein [Thermoplasmata archaeon]MCJ7562799.1 MBL fold metallo-hydrolase [Thermoplasmata archaeon]TFG68895.1 MAG: hypothetical protein E4H25_05290 [Methanomassiliicoccus sp.]